MGKNNFIKNSLPAITLMIIAPLIAELLPGSTRFSSIMVFPIEVLVWGGGALMIRYAVRKRQLGWINMLLLGLALSIAEEFLIQQTSLAPMVIKIKGIEYARSFGINYVYLLWALIYETVFVVFIPICLTEIIFRTRSNELWIKTRGIFITIVLFLIGSFMAWYSWTQIARPAVFHVQAYNPPFSLVLIGVIVIGCLIFAAIGKFGKKLVCPSLSLNPPSTSIIMIIGGLWAVVLYGIVLIAFGILPTFPPLLAIGISLIVAATALYFIPGWMVNERWTRKHTFSIIFGVMIGSMLAGFIGFIGAAQADLYFKILIDLVAVILMILLGAGVNKQLPSDN
jgi:hypothetical protein